jgi:microcin C transport system substrate-binding protein
MWASFDEPIGGVSVRIASLTFGIAVALSGAMACGGGSQNQAPPSGVAVSAPVSAPVAVDKKAYPVFPDADAGADPAVPADQGGKGFTGQGWDTNTDFDLIGDPRAVKGGTLRQAGMTDFPGTLRIYGPNATAWDQMLHGMVYESLVALHPTTLEYIPALATHWQISADKKTFRFRINPNARWSDGMPVTSDDVIWSWKLLVDKGLQDPGRAVVYSNFEQPVAASKYIVSVQAKTINWQNFLYFSGMYIYPAHLLKDLTGESYVRDYNYKLLPGTGPYTLDEKDVVKGKMITIRRRTGYWAEKERRNVGVANFSEIQQIVVRDRNLEFEMFKKGDIDYYPVQRAQMWVEDLNYDSIKRGLNQKRKIFNHNPRGVQGIAINTRREPYGDIRVREALRRLFNRESMIEKMMFNQYLPSDSIFPASVYENPGNQKITYDPQRAVQLLADAGWKDRDSSGRLVKNGRPLNIEIVYGDQLSERYFTIYQEDLRKVGITLNLRFVTFETLVKLIDDRTFDMASIAYTGELFPSPEANLLSELADQKNTNNITGFKNQRADDIIHEYDRTFDFGQRVKLLQELDGIVTGQHHWIFEWVAPYERVVYWNKFGQPPGILTRTGDARDIPSMWWLDPERQGKLDQARRDSSIQLGEGQSEDRYWLDFKRVEAQQQNPVNK